MSVLKVFAMPTTVKITGRISSITNAFVNAVIPSVLPTEKEVLEALGVLALNVDDLRCAYCGDPYTEWDHLRPLVKDKSPTGYISEIANLVPACGKCNQSKGAQHWRDWILSSAPRSPTSRNVLGLNERIDRLQAFEQWREPVRIDFESSVTPELWFRYWQEHEHLLEIMRGCQAVADEVRVQIQKKSVDV